MGHQKELQKINSAIAVLQQKLSLLRSELYRTSKEVDYERIVGKIEEMETQIDKLQDEYEKKRKGGEDA